jgi:hypothetical protein
MSYLGNDVTAAGFTAQPGSPLYIALNSPTAAPGTYNLNVEAMGGGVEQSTPLTVTVPDPSMAEDFTLSLSASTLTLNAANNWTGSVVPTVTPINGFNQTVYFGVSAPTDFVTAKYDADGGAITFTANDPAAGSTQTVTITATSADEMIAHSLDLTLTVAPQVVSTFGFALNLSSTSVTVGSPFTVQVVPLDSWPTPVQVSFEGMPQGLTLGLGTPCSPMDCFSLGGPSGFTAQLNLAYAISTLAYVSVPESQIPAAPGTYAITVLAQSGSISQSQVVAITVPAEAGAQ